MHKKSRKHSGVVLVYSLLKKNKNKNKKKQVLPVLLSVPFSLYSVRWRGGGGGGGGGVVGWRTVPKYFALFPEREPGH